MSSIKCTLRKETKNEIAKYIDNEFINETIKEIVKYIKEVNKVQIDDSNYNKYDINSKVDLIDNGPFNIYDYTYVKDFLYEVSWEGSYIEDLKEIEENDKTVKDQGNNLPAIIKKENIVTKIKNSKLAEVFKNLGSKISNNFSKNKKDEKVEENSEVIDKSKEYREKVKKECQEDNEQAKEGEQHQQEQLIQDKEQEDFELTFKTDEEQDEER